MEGVDSTSLVKHVLQLFELARSYLHVVSARVLVFSHLSVRSLGL